LSTVNYNKRQRAADTALSLTSQRRCRPLQLLPFTVMPTRRNRKGNFLRALEQSPRPLYALDDHRRIVFANRAVGDWLGTSTDQLIGQSCNYHSRADADPIEQIAASLCPPPEVFLGVQRRATVGGVNAGRSGHSAPSKDATFWPFLLDSGAYLVIAIVDSDAETLASDPSNDAAESRTDAVHRQLADWRRQFASSQRLDRVLGNSPAIRAAQRVAQAAIASGADTVVVGPRGGGMEQVARAIHYSQYALGQAPPLIPFDCAVGDAEGLQSALRQVQSDRSATARGRLLLLHADRMDAVLMNELAGFVGLPSFEIGLLSTCEVSLRTMAEQRRFDRGLAQHLSTLELSLPPLIERIQDLPLICQALIEDFNAEGNRQFTGLEHEALEWLRQYPWPGNVDELAQVISEACRTAEGTLIRAADLPKRIHQGVAAARVSRPVDVAIDLPSFLKEVEDELMSRAMRAAKGNKATAARKLGISRQRMIRWSSQQESAPSSNPENG
jgi:transcriptional regulator with PAS, ATPase and Fis domain